MFYSRPIKDYSVRTARKFVFAVLGKLCFIISIIRLHSKFYVDLCSLYNSCVGFAKLRVLSVVQMAIGCSSERCYKLFMVSIRSHSLYFAGKGAM